MNTHFDLRAYGWLYEKHPRTAIHNLPQLIKPVCTVKATGKLAPHGYWKDLLNILCLATLREFPSIQYIHESTFLYPDRPVPSKSKWRQARDHNSETKNQDKPACAAAHQERQRLESANAYRKRVDKACHRHINLVERLDDPKFRALYISVARLFATQLLDDFKLLNRIQFLPEGEERVRLIHQLSLAGKWAPTPGLTHDRHTNISTAVSILLHHSNALETPRVLAGLDQGLPSLEAHVLRSFYQRWLLGPLREIKSIPEPLMAANRWKDVRYTRVSSKSMHKNSLAFYSHDREGFEKYLTAVETGRKVISGATLMPHDLLNDAIACYKDTLHTPFSDRPNIRDLKKQISETRIRVIDAQWATMINRLRQSGSVDNAIAICDVSGSMGTFYDAGRRRKDGFVHPIFPALSLSMVLAQLAKPPFANCFITFSQTPQLVQFNPSESLTTTARQMVETDWGMNTDFEAVFLKLLLPIAIKHKVKREDMIKRLFVFSDMQFDESRGIHTGYMDYTTPSAEIPSSRATSAQWDTNHDVIERAFHEAGYDLPEIVYWNLSHYTASIPATSERKGVALMNGFSPAMLKVFMGESEGLVEGQESQNKTAINPIDIMKIAVSKNSYDELVVLD